MVRLSELDKDFAQHLRELPLPTFTSNPWTAAPTLERARVAIISTAGLHRRSDPVFAPGASDYRLIPGDVTRDDLVMSHVSVNFDRSGFQRDVSVVFPLEPLRELQRRGEIDSVADWHYSFMGATDPSRMEETGKQVANLLRKDSVDIALLVPI